LFRADNGHYVGLSIVYGDRHVRNEAHPDGDYMLSGKCQLEIATELVDCSVYLMSLSDPQTQRIKN